MMYDIMQKNVKKIEKSGAGSDNSNITFDYDGKII